MGDYKPKEGWRAVNIWLSPEELAKVDELGKAMDKSHSTEVFRKLLSDAKVGDYRK